ncbi:MAG: chromate resistance protein [Hyphomonadaceae bacterium]|nr:chromate resistance protein [Hyphomonadaceae bacterium]
MTSHPQSILGELFGSTRPTRWVTRERPKIDRIACPWLIRRFLDPEAQILYVPTPQVLEVAQRERAVAFDIPGAPLTHDGEMCSFDAFLRRFGLSDPGLDVLAPIVRGADIDRHDLAPEAAGLHAISLGMSANFADDHELLEHGIVVYDALYAWATGAKDERHGWNPQ